MLGRQPSALPSGYATFFKAFFAACL